MDASATLEALKNTSALSLDEDYQSGSLRRTDLISEIEVRGAEPGVILQLLTHHVPLPRSSGPSATLRETHSSWLQLQLQVPPAPLFR